MTGFAGGLPDAMSTRSEGASSLAGQRVLVVGAGGLGAPAAEVLVDHGVGHLRLVDDDRVEPSNLHRQLLFDEGDVGHPKARAGALSLAARADRVGTGTCLEPVEGRFLPTTAHALLADVDLVLEGTDNFASKFLVADACAGAGVPVVHAGVIRWAGWVLASGESLPGAHGRCLRCVFEDVPHGAQATCDAAGVVGPVVGVVGAMAASLAVRRLSGDRGGTLSRYDGLAGRLRTTRPRARAACALAGAAVDLKRPGRYLRPAPGPDPALA